MRDTWGSDDNPLLDIRDDMIHRSFTRSWTLSDDEF